MATNINDMVFQVHEYWLTDGPPRKTFRGAGTLFKELNKTVYSGWSGTGVGKLPVRTKVSGNGGPNYSEVFTLATPSGGAQFLQPIAEHWEVLSMPARVMELTKNKNYLESGMEGFLDEMEQKAEGWMKSMSYTLWGDSRGAVGKGDGSFLITGSTIKFLNRRSAKCFQVGDSLRSVSTANYDAVAGQGILPTPRTNVTPVLVTAVNEQTGEVTTNVADLSAAITGFANTDYISKSSYFGSDTGLTAGVFTWLAKTNTIAGSTLYGVDRSVQPTELAGRRIALTGGESPYDIVTSILTEAVDTGAEINRIYVPTGEIKQLMAEMASRQVIYQRVDIGEDDPAHLRMMVTGISAGFGSVACEVVSDPYLIDHEVTEANDRTYVGLKVEDMSLNTTDSKIGWKDFEGDGTYIMRNPANQNLVAEYGAFLNFAPQDTGHMFVARVGANL